MTAFIDWIVWFYRSIFDLFGTIRFELGGYNVTLGSIIFACIALYMIISIYWRGAKG